MTRHASTRPAQQSALRILTHREQALVVAAGLEQTLRAMHTDAIAGIRPSAERAEWAVHQLTELRRLLKAAGVL